MLFWRKTLVCTFFRPLCIRSQKNALRRSNPHSNLCSSLYWSKTCHRFFLPLIATVEVVLVSALMIVTSMLMIVMSMLMMVMSMLMIVMSMLMIVGNGGGNEAPPNPNLRLLFQLAGIAHCTMHYSGIADGGDRRAIMERSQLYPSIVSYYWQ